MKHALFFLYLTVCFSALPLHSFRPRIDSAPELLEKFNAAFLVDSQAELSEMVLVGPSGLPRTVRTLIVYQYPADKVFGLWRLLPEEGEAGMLVLSRQVKGELPRLWRMVPGDSGPEEIRGSALRGRMGNTPWHYEDVIDDDKEEWELSLSRGTRWFEGSLCNIVEGNWGDDYLRTNTAYSRRLFYITRETNQVAHAIFYDREGKFMKSTTARQLTNVGTPDDPQIWPHQRIIYYAPTEETAVQTVVAAKYNFSLPEGLFEPDFLEQWNPATDEELIGYLDELDR